MALDPRGSIQQERALVAWILFYSLGVLGTLAAYGLLQERIMVYPYDGEYFTVSIFLVFCNRVAAIVFSIFMIVIRGDSFRNKAPLWKYMVVSLSNVTSSYCQYEALKWVTFPVQMLGKSFKMMPVMCWGMAISRKTYTWKDWLAAAVITWGVLQFLLFGSIAVPNKPEHATCLWGIVLLVGYLACDSFTSTMQEKLFKEDAVSKYNQMLYINVISALVTLIAALSMHAMNTARLFCTLHPQIVVDIVELCFTSIAGQWFIYSLVKDFGALILATTLVVRQVVSTLISYMYYRHLITPLQVTALAMVFGSLLTRSLVRLAAFRAHQPLEKSCLVTGRLDAREQRREAQGCLAEA
mmetsp:Transcript_5370/g.15868  ORF Transcript_5370/g.15868 Transcript_5370/m.15868 type:complete len:354 (+) Transcript_5370:49-1110(+)|eukprot:CAMPEP_0168387020 /NCGR_PEP_ID=MMETSP0228-20121227/15729_1 /TAXON_ID=133427 /ORGANISM="Protoceratium reticulatum, Strain CCCM 535 (=CCMP 1889)" /LENGTH=353 /DNA_ID=CAMNT_0008400241 /DNA_START=49 /DNA_END=1110 /DNA_ORIENTATION=+